MRISTPIVCVVTRARGASGSPERRSLLDRLAAAAAAGASMIQVRERLLDDRALVGFVTELREAAARSPCRIIVNDRTDVALAAGAAGVHLKGQSVRPADVRTIVPADFIVGCSVHSEDEAIAVEGAGGCDYLLFGTVFHSQSKPEHHPVAGVDALRRVCARVSLPVAAIGGVTAARGAELTAAGAAGAAVIGFFADARDGSAAVRALRDALTPNRGNV